MFVVLAVAAPAAAQKSPDDELRSLQVPDDVEIAVYASEPLITNPAAIDVDTHGRVWVAEIEGYRRSAKNPPGEKIKVLEDADGDGRADKVTVFCDDAFAPMSICVAGSKVYLATSPDLWVYEDRDGDLKADGPPKKLLTGFGGFNHDHGAHSLVLGPDHKWWMSHGDAGYDVTGPDGSKIAFPAGGIIRGELDGTKLENVATNFRNPYEVCVNSFGEAFCSDNDNDGNFSVRICWILEGGNYGWYKRPGPKFPPGTPFGETWHFRGPIPGFVPGTLVTGFGSPCGMCFYEGDAFPQYKNMPLHCDAGPREVRAYPHEKAGAGYKATQKNIVTSKDDAYFRPTDVTTMPDGSVVVSDWYDGAVGGHAYNNPTQGRIFRLTPKGKTLARIGKPGPYTTTADAIEALKNPNLATQFLAREKLLADGEAAVPALVELTKTATDANHAARASWVLDRIGGAGRDEVVKQLDAKEPATQALAVRILRRHTNDASLRTRLVALNDKLYEEKSLSSEVARELLSYFRTDHGENAETRIAKIAGRYDGSDRFFIEAVRVATGPRTKNVAEMTMTYAGYGPSNEPNIGWKHAFYRMLDRDRYLTDLGASIDEAPDNGLAFLLESLGVELHDGAYSGVLKIATNSRRSSKLRSRALEWLTFNCAPTGLWSGIVGQADASVSAWTDYKPPQDFDGRGKLVACAKQLLSEPDYQTQALGLISAAGLSELGPEIVALVTSSQTAPAVREQAIQVAVATRPAGVAEALVKLLSSDNEKLRNDAVAALVDTAQWKEVQKLVAAGAPKPQVQNVINRMMNTTGGALVVLKWIDARQLDDAARTLAVSRAAKHPDANVRVLFEKYIPEGDRPQRLGAAIKPADILQLVGDAARGEQIFNQSSAAQCKNCHAVRGFGKKLGPDLTTIGKKYERAALLETILDPSKAIAHEYVTYVVETDEGQAYTGFVEKNDRFVTIRTAEDKQIRLPAKSVESITPSPKSMMPELVLREVTAQDAADLLAYLMTLKEPLPQK